MFDDAHDIPAKVPYTIEAAMLVRRKAFVEVGKMDERFFLYCEDEDLCERMWLAGWEVWYVPQAKVIHAYARASQGFNLLTIRHIQSAMRLLFKRLKQHYQK
jgi:GT2 family glycosyltransferase